MQSSYWHGQSPRLQLKTLTGGVDSGRSREIVSRILTLVNRRNMFSLKQLLEHMLKLLVKS